MQALEHVRAVLGPLRGLGDARLLEAFVVESDPDAFAELVHRYGPLVMGACRRILRHQQDAEDAFQAVFIVLAQKAETVHPPEKLPAWLHGVACRTALKARSMSLRRQERELAVADPSRAVEPEELPEWLPALDEEVQRLPEKYRLPILLCGLEGHTRRAAAELLDWPEGTVAGRFHRAKAILAHRLTKRGISLSVATLTAWLTGAGARAAVPSTARLTATRAAPWARLGEAGAPLSSASHTLAQGVLKMMASSKWKSMMTCLCLLGMTVGVGLFGPVIMSKGEDGSGSPRSSSPDQPALEPLDPDIVLEKGVQKELRLSPNQVRKLRAAWDAGKTHAKEDVRQRDEIQKRIAELEKQINELRAQKDKHEMKVLGAQRTNLKQAIHDELSERAITRLHQITLRRMSLDRLLRSERIRDRLKLNDEQLKQLEKLRSSSGMDTHLDLTFAAPEYRLSLNKLTTVQNFLYLTAPVRNRDEILKILTPEQRKTWEEMLGEPYPSTRK